MQFWKKTLCGLTAAAAMTFAGASANADLMGFSTPNASGTLPGTSLDANITGGTLSRGAGISYNSAGGDYNSRDWNGTTDLAGAISADDYLQFTIDIATGYEATITTIDFFQDNSGTGPQDFQMRINGVNVGSAYQPNNGTSFSQAVNQVYTGTVEIRLYGWNASSSAGTSDIETNEVGPGSAYGLWVDGSTALIPEPASLILLGLGATAMLGRRNRK